MRIGGESVLSYTTCRHSCGLPACFRSELKVRRASLATRSRLSEKTTLARGGRTKFFSLNAIMVISLVLSAPARRHPLRTDRREISVSDKIGGWDFLPPSQINNAKDLRFVPSIFKLFCAIPPDFWRCWILMADLVELGTGSAGPPPFMYAPATFRTVLGF